MGLTTINGAELNLHLQQQGVQLSRTQNLALLACFKATLTLEEAAAYAGLSLSHFYKLTSSGKVPHYKPAGKFIYIDRDELDDWLKRNRVKTTDEIEREASTYVNTKPAKKKGTRIS